MTTLGIVLAGLCSLAFLVWSGRHLMINRAKVEEFVLTPGYAGPPSDAPFISVLVAAKDEEANIGTCIRTMLQQDYPRFELLVINDRSSDRTAQIVEEIAACDSRVRLVNIASLPEGWCGKNHAMWTGIKQAKGEWLCMIDADCRQTSPRTLSTAMQYATDNKSDMLSVLPILEMKGFWENVVQPVCSGVMVIWFQPKKVNSDKFPHAYANGAFMMMKKSAYQAIGTHEAVRMQVNEDMHMALRLKQKGLRLRVVQSEGLYIVRMYTSLKQILAGWSRIFFGTFGTMKRLVASLLVLSIMGVLPYLTALAGWLLWQAGMAGPAWKAAAIMGTMAATMQMSVIYRFYGLLKARQELFWTYGLGCVVGIVALIKSIGKLRAGGKVVWRNTSYAVGGKK